MRKLTALAVAAALALPAAVSAQVTGPQIYGRFHLSGNHMDNGDDSVQNLSNNSSRIGIRGSLELSEELEAFYQLEAGFDADHGKDGELASHNTFAGVRGAFGALQVGYFDSPVKNIGGKVDLFGDRVGDNGNIIRYGFRFGPDNLSFDERQKNMIQYTTPTVSGLQAQLAYSTNVDSESAEDGTDNHSYMAALHYTGIDGLYLGLGYQVYGEDVVEYGKEPSIIRLGATYTLGNLKLTGLAQQASDITANGDDAAAYGLGAAYTLGKAVLKGQFYLLDHDAQESDANMIALGVDYKLNKNFTTYVAYSRLSNDDNQKLRPYADGISDALGAGTAGEDTQAFGVGFIYNF